MGHQASTGNFWEGKTPCWAIRGCVAAAQEICQATHDPARPCWEQTTLCKKLFGIDTCSYCEVRRLYDASLSRLHRIDPADPPWRSCA